MTDKEFALALNFSKAPQELQDAATASAALKSKIAKINKQILQAKADLEQANLDSGVADKVFRKILEAWDGTVSTKPAVVKS